MQTVHYIYLFTLSCCAECFPLSQTSAAIGAVLLFVDVFLQQDDLLPANRSLLHFCWPLNVVETTFVSSRWIMAKHIYFLN